MARCAPGAAGSSRSSARRHIAPTLHDGPVGHPRSSPHQSSMNSASACAVWSTDGSDTRSSTAWIDSACGPKQTAGVPAYSANERASVVAVDAISAGRAPIAWSAASDSWPMSGESWLERVALAGEAVVDDAGVEPAGQPRGGARDRRLDAGLQLVDARAREQREPAVEHALGGDRRGPVAAPDHPDVEVDRVLVDVVREPAAPRSARPRAPAAPRSRGSSPRSRSARSGRRRRERGGRARPPGTTARRPARSGSSGSSAR